ncbi:MAG: methylmalonyl-CoA mutase family protein [Ignavibacteria bacterium]
MTKLPENFSVSSDFSSISYEEWKSVAEKELKGADFKKKLFTTTYEGITLKPIYTREDIENLEFLLTKPGFPNFVRGISSCGYLCKEWEINQFLPYPSPRKANEALKQDIEKGQNVITIKPDLAFKTASIPSADSGVGVDGTSIFNLNDFCNLLSGINIIKYPLYIDSGYGGLFALALLAAYIKKGNFDPVKVRGGIEIDPYGFAVHYGYLPAELNIIFDCMKMVTEYCKNNLPNLFTININSTPYHNAGATAIQELAFSLATAVEYINMLLDRGLDIGTIAPRIKFTFGTGPFFFTEIAKLRAARILWNNIIQHYGGSEEDSKMFIHSVTSEYNLTFTDPYVNMLRTTTETFSAIVGGANSITTHPFDLKFGLTDEFGRRIARNTQIILKEEAHLGQVVDPAGGSYYVEALTEEIARLVWKKFQDIVSNGGMYKLLLSSLIQKEVAETNNLRLENYKKRKDVLIGTNLYANLKEQTPEFKTLNYNEFATQRIEELAQHRKQSEIKPQEFEKIKLANQKGVPELIRTMVNALLAGAAISEISSVLRDGKEKKIEFSVLQVVSPANLFFNLRQKSLKIKETTGKLPAVYLIPYGRLSEYKARADFAKEFFEVGGFNVIYPSGFSTISKVIEDSKSFEGKVFVICSDDKTYKEIVPSLTDAIKKVYSGAIVILAGYPKEDVDTYRKSGVDNFIYLGDDVYSKLNSILELINAR